MKSRCVDSLNIPVQLHSSCKGAGCVYQHSGPLSPGACDCVCCAVCLCAGLELPKHGLFIGDVQLPLGRESKFVYGQCTRWCLWPFVAAYIRICCSLSGVLHVVLVARVLHAPSHKAVDRLVWEVLVVVWWRLVLLRPCRNGNSAHAACRWPRARGPGGAAGAAVVCCGVSTD